MNALLREAQKLDGMHVARNGDFFLFVVNYYAA